MLALLTSLSLAAPLPNTPPAQPAQCKWVHGRFAIYLGSGIRRIWLIGTRRMVNLYDTDEDIPPEIARYQENFGNYQGLKDALFGDFYVCALEPSRPGHMQHVHLVRTRNLILRGEPYPPK
jgi:hypothetical protein